MPYRSLHGVAADAVSLDLNVPDGVGNAPVVVFVHGGGWQRGSKGTGAGGKADAFAARGIAFASINYRMHPDVDPGVMAEDVVAALVHLRANAARYGIDPDRIALMGHSAGAHLAALAATDQDGLRRAGLPLVALRAVILLDGAGYDVARQATSGRNAKLYLEVFGNDPADWARWSPVTHARSAEGLPPFLIAYVRRADAPEQAAAMADAVETGGGAATLLLAEGERHGSINRGFGEADDATTIAAFDVLSRAFR